MTTMDKRFRKLVKQDTCPCGSCCNCGDIYEMIERFRERNEVGYCKWGVPSVYVWRDGSRTETIAIGPGHSILKDDASQ